MKWAVLFLFISSCSLFKSPKLSQNTEKASENICLSSQGKGRLQVGSSKYVFSYESALDEEHAQWILALNFPLRPQETFKLDWSESSKVRLISSLDQKILKENRNIDPARLDTFTQGLGDLIQEILAMRGMAPVKSKKFRWKRMRGELKSLNPNKNLKGEFSKLTSEGYFGLMQLSYLEPDKNYYKLDLVVRKCFEKTAELP